jgi:hypothetical protein
MTDYNSFEMEVRIRELGILYYLIKSVEIENLKPLLDHIARRKKFLEKENTMKHGLKFYPNQILDTRINYLKEQEIQDMNIEPSEIITHDKEIEERSICSTCEHFSNCMLRRKNKKPVIFCEEFQLAGPQRVSSNGDEKANWEEAGRSGSAYLGLCRTCRKLPSCTAAIPGRGTWECADYEKSE